VAAGQAAAEALAAVSDAFCPGAAMPALEESMDVSLQVLMLQEHMEQARRSMQQAGFAAAAQLAGFHHGSQPAVGCNIRAAADPSQQEPQAQVVLAQGD